MATIMILERGQFSAFHRDKARLNMLLSAYSRIARQDAGDARLTVIANRVIELADEIVERAA